MACTVQQFFTNQALHLRHGQFDVMARSYGVPLVVIMPTGERDVSLLPSRAAVAAFFRTKFEGLEEAGIDYLRAMVSEVETVSERRHAATVTWYYVDGNGARQGETRARYFLGRRSGGLTVEMIEFERLAFDAIADWVAQHERKVPGAGIDPRLA